MYPAGKDITELFMDTGIGSDSYAIIELKMVDEILNDKNNAIKTCWKKLPPVSPSIRQEKTDFI